MLFIIPIEVYTDMSSFSMAIFWILWVPTIVACRDPTWGRCYESYNEDPKVVESMRTIILDVCTMEKLEVNSMTAYQRFLYDRFPNYRQRYDSPILHISMILETKRR